MWKGQLPSQGGAVQWQVQELSVFNIVLDLICLPVVGGLINIWIKMIQKSMS